MKRPHVPSYQRKKDTNALRFLFQAIVGTKYKAHSLGTFCNLPTHAVVV
jgi:hypothetical protein